MTQAAVQKNPILILQMQRMGDLVLSYPLCAWLAATFPGYPIWMVGEKIFFEGLIDISPAVTYFDYADSAHLLTREFSLIINLSHRREAAGLAGRLRSAKIIGPYIRPAQANSNNAAELAGKNNSNAVDYGNAALNINGAWQLYRSSVTHNNRHNLFHWADLNAMDLVSETVMLRTAWPMLNRTALRNDGARPDTATSGRVGLFVGASEPDKRPEPAFWAGLASRLIRQGAHPVLLGGPADAPLAAETARLLKSAKINLCGKFGITELCLFMRELDLLIVPDTGPMHLAAWLGTPVLNLSMGPVNPWETGPSAPGHLVMRGDISCSGCWRCRLPGIPCKRSFTPDKVALVAEALLFGGNGNQNAAVLSGQNVPDQVSTLAPLANLSKLAKLELPGNSLWLTGRDEHGLFNLRPLLSVPRQKNNNDVAEYAKGNRLERSRFWKQFFLLALGRQKKTEQNLQKLRVLAIPLHENKLAGLLLSQGQMLLLSLNREIRGGHSGTTGALANQLFWQKFLPVFRPLSSYTQLYLQNAEFNKAAFASALEQVELLVEALRP